MPDDLNVVTRQRFGKGRGKSFRPVYRVFRGIDQILAQFDQHMRQAAQSAVLVHCVACQRSVIGFVVADVQRAILLQSCKQASGQPRIRIP